MLTPLDDAPSLQACASTYNRIGFLAIYGKETKTSGTSGLAKNYMDEQMYNYILYIILYNIPELQDYTKNYMKLWEEQHHPNFRNTRTICMMLYCEKMKTISTKLMYTLVCSQHPNTLL